MSLKDLAVTGRDLIALGMMPGREIGTLLDRLLEIVLEEPERNTRDELLRICAEKTFCRDLLEKLHLFFILLALLS